MSQDTVKITGVTISETETANAVRVWFPTLDRWEWVPFSQINRMTRTQHKEFDSLEVSAWWAKQVGVEV